MSATLGFQSVHPLSGIIASIRSHLGPAITQREAEHLAAGWLPPNSRGFRVRCIH
jgi:hypothetical protein